MASAIVLRRRRQAHDIFADSFNDIALNPAFWVSTDTESKITTSGSNLVVAGGKDTPAWDDPRATHRAHAFDIAPGIVFSWKVNCSAFGATGGQFGFDASNPVAKDLVPSFWLKAAPQVTNVVGTSITIPQTLVVGIEYELVLLFDGNGYPHYCIKTNIEKTLARLYMGATDLRGARYLGFSNNDLAFTSDLVRVYQGPAPQAWLVGSAPTHAFGYGAELLTDNDLEGTYTGGKCNALITRAGAPTYVASADAQSGSKAQQITATAQYDVVDHQAVVVAGNYYRVISWNKRTAGATGNAATMGTNADSSNATATMLITSAAYSRYLATVRATQAFYNIRVVEYNAASFDTIITDNHSLTAITSGIYSLVGDPGTRNVIVDGNLTLTNAYSQKGVMWAVDDYTSATPTGLLAYYNGNDGKVYFDKVVAGVPTNLTSGSVTYGAAKRFHIVSNGASHAVYYDNALVGSVQTVPTGQGYGTQVVDFSTEDTTGTAWSIWKLSTLSTVLNNTTGGEAPMGQSGIYQCTPTITAGEGGMDICFGDANNKLRAWHNATNVGLKKIVAGSSSDVVAATAAAYAAARVIKVEIQGQNAYLWYNGVYIGTGAITALGVALTGVGCQEYSSDAGADWGTFTLQQETP